MFSGDFPSAQMLAGLLCTATTLGVIEVLSTVPPFPRRLYKDGDFIIGAIVPASRDAEQCSELSSSPMMVPEAILWVEALTFAIDEINENQDLLGNVTIGYDIRDSCFSSQMATQHTLDFIDSIAAFSSKQDVDCSDDPSTSYENNVSSASSSFGEPSKEFAAPTKEFFGGHAVHFNTLNGQKKIISNLSYSANHFFQVTKASESEDSKDSPIEACAGKPVVALIGCLTSDLTSAAAGLAQASMLPVLSFMSTVASLSDTARYPTFLRTIMADNAQARLLTDLMLKYDWSYISIIGTENEYGRQGVESLFEYTEGKNICVALKEFFDPESETRQRDIARIIRAVSERREASVVVLFMGWPYVHMVLEEAEAQNLTGIVWMGTDSWGRHPSIQMYNRSLVEGTIALSLPRLVFPRFREYLRDLDVICSSDHPWLYRLLCSRGICDPEVIELHQECCKSYFLKNKIMLCPLPPALDVLASLQDLAHFVSADTIFNAVRTVVYGLEAYLKNNTQNGDLLGFQRKNFKHRDFLECMREGEFVDVSGKKVKYTANGDITDISYEVVNLQFDECKESLIWRTVGKAAILDGQVSLTIRDDLVRFTRGATRVTSRCSAPCVPGSKVLLSPQECCWECQPCLEGTVTNASMSRQCTMCDVIEHTDVNRTRCIPDTLQWLQITDPVGIVILVASVIGQIITLTVISILGRHKNNPVCSALAFKTTSLLVCFAGFLQPLIYTVQPSAMLCTFQKLTWFCVYIVHGATMVARTYKVKFLVDRLKRFLGHKLHNVHHAVMWMFALVGFIMLGVSFLGNVPEVSYKKDSPEATFVMCVESMEVADVTIIVYPLLLLVITGLLAETSKHSRSLDDKFLSYTSSAMLLMLVIFLPIYYTIDDGIGKVVILAVSVIITQYAVLCLTYFTKIYYMFRSYHKKENVRSALALERQNMASLSERSDNEQNGVTSSNTVR